MRNDSRTDSSRIGNDEINARFGVFKKDVRERDTRRKLPLSKMTLPMETSISFQEAGTLAAKRCAMMILALTTNPKSPRGFQT